MNKKGKGTGKIQNALISRGYNFLDPLGQDPLTVREL